MGYCLGITYLCGVNFKRLLSLPFALNLTLKLPEKPQLCKLQTNAFNLYLLAGKALQMVEADFIMAETAQKGHTLRAFRTRHV